MRRQCASRDGRPPHASQWSSHQVQHIVPYGHPSTLFTRMEPLNVGSHFLPPSLRERWPPNVMHRLEAAQSFCLRSAFRNAPMVVGSSASGQIGGSVSMVPSRNQNAGKLTEIKTETSTKLTRSSSGPVRGRGLARPRRIGEPVSGTVTDSGRKRALWGVVAGSRSV